MGLPWLRILDAVIGVTDLARSRKMGAARQSVSDEISTRAPAGQLETRLAGVVVAALKEVFDRDARRLELEAEQLEAERRRADRALRLELLRQAADREIGRLRLLAGAAVAAWIGSLFFAARLARGGLLGRVALGAGWVLLLAAIATSVAAQGRVAATLDKGEAIAGAPGALRAGAANALTPWLIIAGLALVSLALLV